MNPGRGLSSVAKLDSIVKINPRQTFLARIAKTLPIAGASDRRNCRNSLPIEPQ